MSKRWKKQTNKNAADNPHGGWGRHRGREGPKQADSLIVQLKVHAIMDLIVGNRYVVLEDCVPLLQDDLVPGGACLSCYELLQVPNCVIRVALDSYLDRKSVV